MTKRTAEAHPKFVGRLRDGTAVFAFSDPAVLDAWHLEQEQDRADRNGQRPDIEPDDDPGPPEPPPDESCFIPSRNTATTQQSRSTMAPAVALLRRILDAVAEEVASRGLVGEERLAKTLYLVLTSRLLDKQVSAGVKGHSASGKSYTVETVTRFFPREAYLEFTAMSEKALVYSPEEYAHRTLVIYEITALREGVEDDLTNYFVRSLLSEGRIEYPVTVRAKDGGFTTKKIVKQGPTNLVFTTTKTQVHAENETRILSLATDDSRQQTARVLLELADEHNNGHDLEEWRDFQRWLADAEHRVTIPYSHQLALLVPPVAVRLRRDFGSVLALIRAHAVLHQVNRDRDPSGAIVATLDDYAAVRDLVADTIAQGVGATVSETVRDTVAAVADLAPAEGVALRAIAEKLRLDKSTVSRRVRTAADGGYLRNLEDKRGKPGRWVIGDPLPESVALLPDPAQLATAGTTLDQECCGVAPDFQGESSDGNGVMDPAHHPTQLTREAPLCTVCGGPVTAGQGDTHLSCHAAAVAAARRARIAEAPPDDYAPPPPADYSPPPPDDYAPPPPADYSPPPPDDYALFGMDGDPYD